jgi:hypothetical protein
MTGPQKQKTRAFWGPGRDQENNDGLGRTSVFGRNAKNHENVLCERETHNNFLYSISAWFFRFVKE